MTNEQDGGAVDRNDRRLYYAVALAGVTMAMGAINATMETTVFSVGIALALFVVFLNLVRMTMPGRGKSHA